MCIRDRGMMFGYASTETPTFMPAPIWYAQKLVKRHAELRHLGATPDLLPDAKSQLTFKYINGKPVSIDSIVFSSHHKESISNEELKRTIKKEIIDAILPSNFITNDTKIMINPTGRFVIGGPIADCGLTGRKIIADTYGGAAHHGGGCFSGKDPSKVDRSAAYMARYVAKNIVALGLADQCEIQLSYAIGVAEPVGFLLNTFGTGIMPDHELEEVVVDYFDFTPYGIISHLGLLKPIYYYSSCYGHFGRDDHDFPWEKLDMLSVLSDDTRIKKSLKDNLIT